MRLLRRRPTNPGHAEAVLQGNGYEYLKGTGGAINAQILADITNGVLVAGEDMVWTGSYEENSDLGGGLYRLVAGGTGTEDGGSYINVGTLQLEAIFGEVIHASQFGVIGDGATGGDQTDRLQAALDAQNARSGGIVLLPAGEIELADRVEVPQGVSLVGSGRSGIAEFDGTRFKLTTATAGIDFAAGAVTNRGTSSGWFSVDANNLGGTAVHIGLMVHTSIQEITVDNGAGIGFLYDGAQNSFFRGLHAHFATVGHSIESGTGGNVFDRISASNCGVGLKIDPNGKNIGGYGSPTDNVYIHILLERPAGAGPLLDLVEGVRNTFIAPTISASDPGLSYLVALRGSAVDNRFHDPFFHGHNDSGLTAAILVEGYVTASFSGQLVTSSLLVPLFDLVSLNSGSRIELQHVRSGPPTDIVTATSPTTWRRNIQHRLEVDLEIHNSTSGIVLQDRANSSTRVRVYYDSAGSGLSTEPQ